MTGLSASQIQVVVNLGDGESVWSLPLMPQISERDAQEVVGAVDKVIDACEE
jgi:hypothetical protein